jgi:outer membrane protein TolC
MLPRALLAVLAAALALAAAAGAQTQLTPPVPPPPPAPFRGKILKDQWTPGVPRSKAVEVPAVLTHDTEVQRVSLKDAIALALEHNPGIAARRLEPTRQVEGILGAQSKFDPSLNSELNYGRSELPNATLLAGALTSVVEEKYANLHLTKLLRTGTQFSLDFLNDRYDSNSTFYTLRPEYKPHFGFSVTQPLLRNFGWDFSYLVVRVAEQTADAAFYQYEANLADFVLQVVVAYWNVVNAREQLEVQRESKGLADKTVEENQARVKVGLLPPVAVLEAQADAAQREEQVIAAENTLQVARAQLSQLAYYSPSGDFVPRTLEPVEGAEPEQVDVEPEATLRAALDQRPEVLASAKGIRVQELNEKIAGNALLPQLDAVGTYGYDGLSGQCVHPIVNGVRTPGCNPFAGSLSNAYASLPDSRSYSFGVRIQVPIANAAAESQFVQSRISREQAELDHRNLLSQVTLDVRQSIADVVSGRKRIESSRVAVRLAEENLRNQEKRHEVGMATTKDLLDFQSRLTTARGTEVQAKTDYAIAVSRWRRAQGALLREFQIVVDRGSKLPAPWFAKF